MTETIRLPKMDLSMEEGRLVRWLVPPGVPIAKGQIIAEIETDKAIVEMEMPRDGIIAKYLAEEGESLPVGRSIAELMSSEGASKTETKTIAMGNVPDYRIRISPAARRRSRELGVDYSALKGSGPQGRILFQDIEEAARLGGRPSSPDRKSAEAHVPRPSSPAGSAEGKALPLSGMRRTIARRMAESVRTIPQFTLKRSADVSHPLQLKRLLEPSLAASGLKLSLTDFILSATALALVKHPELNASFIGDPADPGCRIVRHPDVHVGLAVSTEGGLFVPVLHHAARLSLAEIARMRTARIEAAQRQVLKPEDMQGGTFTVSNLGMFGIEEFQAIVNPPEAGILAVGAVQEKPRLHEGKLEFRPTVTIAGSFDHRVVDGAEAASFLRTLVEQLESDKWNLIGGG